MSLNNVENMLYQQSALAVLSWADLRERLEAQKTQMYQQIGTYPTPVAGCDQQFNHLLAQQQQVIQELSRLQAAEAADESQRAIAAFVESSPCFEG